MSSLAHFRKPSRLQMDFSYKELKQSLVQWKLPTCFKERISLKQNKYGLAWTIIIPGALNYFPLERAVETSGINRIFFCCGWAAIVHLYTLHQRLGAQNILHTLISCVCLFVPRTGEFKCPFFFLGTQEITSSLVFLQDYMLQDFREMSNKVKRAEAPPQLST